MFVAGASEPPGRVTVNDRPAALEGIAFRLLLRYRHPGRELIRISATQPGFRPARAWIAVCVTRAGASGHSGSQPEGGQGSPGGGPRFSPGQLRGGVPAGPQLSQSRARGGRCPVAG